MRFFTRLSHIERLLSRAIQLLVNIHANQETVMAALDDLAEQVAANKTVIGSALTLIKGFATRLEAAGTDVAKLAALKDDLKSQDEELAAAVAANTPAQT